MLIQQPQSGPFADGTPRTPSVRLADAVEAWFSEIVDDTPKMHERRTVVYLEFLDEPVEAACKGKKRDALLRGDNMAHLRPAMP